MEYLRRFENKSCILLTSYLDCKKFSRHIHAFYASGIVELEMNIMWEKSGLQEETWFQGLRILKKKFWYLQISYLWSSNDLEIDAMDLDWPCMQISRTRKVMHDIFQVFRTVKWKPSNNAIYNTAIYLRISGMTCKWPLPWPLWA